MLEPTDNVLAFWQGGAAAFDRIDGWSDIDLMVLTPDDQDTAVLALIEKTLEGVSPIQSKLELAMPTWQIF